MPPKAQSMYGRDELDDPKEGGAGGSNNIRETMWHMHRRMVTGTMILSILLLYALAVTVYSNLSHAKMFSFGWSNRIIENPGRDAVAALYRDNKDTSSANLDAMLRAAMQAASCRPILFSGGIQWDESQVSPTCNCVRNTHVEYVKAVTPYGVRLPESVMDSEQSRRNRLWISNRLKTECFQNLRHTQMEDISDPYTNDNETSFTNIVGVTVFWNVISCTTAVFVYYFDVMAMDQRSSPSSGAASVKDAEAGSGRSSSGSSGGSYFFVVSFLGLLWPIISLAFFHGPVQSAVLIVLSVVFYAITMIMHAKWGENQDVQQGYDMYPTRKKIVFWLGYVLSAPAVLMACNMLMQRRDVMYNFTTVFMVVVIGLCSLASEMIYTGYEQFYINVYTAKDVSRKDSLKTDLDESIINYKEQKNCMVKMNLVVTLILVAAIGCTTFPVFSSTPFSNTYAAMFVALPVLLVIPPLITGRIISLVPNETDAKNASGAAGQTWVLELTNIEFLARAFFTVAVIYDLASLAVADDVVVAL